MSRSHVAAQVHKAIRDGDYAWLPELLDTGHHDGSEGTSTFSVADILWESNSSGWTAVHYAASHFLPVEWWRWILVRAATVSHLMASTIAANSSKSISNPPSNYFVSVRNDLGETVFDIFFRSFLAPLPWQSTQVKNGSKLLLQAIEQVCGCAGDGGSHVGSQVSTRHENCQIWLQQIRNELQDETAMQHSSLFGSGGQQEFRSWREDISRSTTANNSVAERPPKSMAVERCVRFCRNLQLLCQAAESMMDGNDPNSKSRVTSTHYPFTNVITFLAEHTGGCPEPVARLLLALYPQQACSPIVNKSNQTSTSLLHLWSAYHRSIGGGDSTRKLRLQQQMGMLAPLLQAYPQAAQIDDSTGRYPLHHAMASGNKSWHSLRPLFEAAPFVLQCVDPVTGLYPVFLLAMSAPSPCHGKSTAATTVRAAFHDGHTNRNKEPNAIEIRARQNSAGEKGLVSLWYIMPASSRQEALQRAARELECEELESIYLALRAFPRALGNTTA